MYTVSGLFDLEHTLAKSYLASFTYPWEAVSGIREMILSIGNTLGEDYQQISPQVWVHRTARIAPTAYLGAPCIIGSDTEVRHCAFIRESALIGANCVVGNSVEIKNAILFDNVETPHYNYVGDSILGYKAHMGAGSATSNFRADHQPVTVRVNGQAIPTGLAKLGAMLGDEAEVGCNAVLNPGVLVGRQARIYPLTCVRGAVPARSILKNNGELIPQR